MAQDRWRADDHRQSSLSEQQHAVHTNQAT